MNDNQYKLIKKTGVQPTFNPAQKQAIAEVLRKGVTATSVANGLGVQRQLICRIAAEYGVELKSGFKPGTERPNMIHTKKIPVEIRDELLDQYESGAIRAAEIAERFGCATRNVYKMLNTQKKRRDKAKLREES